MLILNVAPNAALGILDNEIGDWSAYLWELSQEVETVQITVEMINARMYLDLLECQRANLLAA